MVEESLILLGQLKEALEGVKVELADFKQRLEILESRQDWTADDIRNLYADLNETKEQIIEAVEDAIETIEEQPPEETKVEETKVEETTEVKTETTLDTSEIQKTANKVKSKFRWGLWD